MMYKSSLLFFAVFAMFAQCRATRSLGPLLGVDVDFVQFDPNSAPIPLMQISRLQEPTDENELAVNGERSVVQKRRLIMGMPNILHVGNKRMVMQKRELFAEIEGRPTKRRISMHMPNLIYRRQQ